MQCYVCPGAYVNTHLASSLKKYSLHLFRLERNTEPSSLQNTECYQRYASQRTQFLLGVVYKSAEKKIVFSYLQLSLWRV